MRKIIPGVAVLLLLPALACAEVVGRISLDDASKASPRIETDREVKAEGEGSVRIEASWPATLFLGRIDDLDFDDAKLVYRAKVKSELEGSAYLELWVEVDGKSYFSRGMDSMVTGTQDWTELQTPFFLQKGQKVQKATLNLVVNGTGTVWIDDIELDRQPLK